MSRKSTGFSRWRSLASSWVSAVSDALANAYGIAVAGDMLITSFLVAIVAHGVWKWPALIVIVDRRIVFDPRRHLRIGEHP